MSRSRKKTLILKDRGLKRGERNRRVRRVNKILVKTGREPKHPKEVINPYDVVDWKINGHVADYDKKLFRK